MDVVIRPATRDDVPVILAMLYELGRPEPKENSNTLSFGKLIIKYLKDSDKQVLVAEHDNSLIGLVSIMFLTRLNYESQELYIPELIVRKNYQNQGIGKKLVNECIKLGKEKKCHRIRLESGNQRRESHVFYDKQGFERSGLSFSLKLK